jgi:hypothetical protein
MADDFIILGVVQEGKVMAHTIADAMAINPFSVIFEGF